MPGKFFLIEFDEESSADALCAQINAATDKGRPFRVKGVFYKAPKKRCQCGPSKSSRTSTVKRHRVTGFFYCTKCKKVRPGPQGPQNLLDLENKQGNYLSLGESGEPTKNHPILTDAGRP